MRDRPVDVPAAVVPRARATVERLRKLRLGPAQLRSQGVSKQAVPAVPIVWRIERSEQGIAVFESGQRQRRPVALEDGVA